ncbi:hypothetical protein WH47_09142 [Habropoda laboriosa]|uniref:Uncharacterized protein n=1 Tax=Habropoda laboriosa TaxID=597456 RepID=A0A0L7QNA1_9HYME|nr:hypothetical protein WH47_09142 [Habropoda laboriosa]
MFPLFDSMLSSPSFEHHSRKIVSRLMANLEQISRRSPLGPVLTGTTLLNDQYLFTYLSLIFDTDFVALTDKTNGELNFTAWRASGKIGTS